MINDDKPFRPDMKKAVKATIAAMTMDELLDYSASLDRTPYFGVKYFQTLNMVATELRYRKGSRYAS